MIQDIGGGFSRVHSNDGAAQGWARHTMNFGRLICLAGACLCPASDAATESPGGAPGAGTGAEDSAAQADAEVAPREHLLPDWGGVRGMLEERGWHCAVSYVGETLGVVRGGLERGAIYEGLLTAEIGFDTEQGGLWSGGQFQASMVFPHGDGLTADKLGDLFIYSNIEAPTDPRLWELWYEHALVSDRLTLRAGQLGADNEFTNTEQGALFISSACGWSPMLGNNAPTPAYPVATPAVRLEADLGGGWAARVGAYNGDPYPLDAVGAPVDPHGVRFRIRDAFVIGEAIKEWNRGEGATGLPGRALLGGWYHSGRFDDLRRDDGGGLLGDPAGSGNPVRHAGNAGIYALAEQQVTRELLAEGSDQGLWVYSRLGASPADRNQVEFYFESGLTYTGLFGGREEDVGGLALVYGQLSRRLRDGEADAQRFGAPPAPLSDYEVVLETTYRAVVAPGFAVQPVVAYVVHPGGSTILDDGLVVGLRAMLDF